MEWDFIILSCVFYDLVCIWNFLGNVPSNLVDFRYLRFKVEGSGVFWTDFLFSSSVSPTSIHGIFYLVVNITIPQAQVYSLGGMEVGWSSVSHEPILQAPNTHAPLSHEHHLWDINSKIKVLVSMRQPQNIKHQAWGPSGHVALYEYNRNISMKVALEILHKNTCGSIV